MFGTLNTLDQCSGGHCTAVSLPRKHECADFVQIQPRARVRLWGPVDEEQGLSMEHWLRVVEFVYLLWKPKLSFVNFLFYCFPLLCFIYSCSSICYFLSSTNLVPFYLVPWGVKLGCLCKISYFEMYMFITINFPLNTTFPESYNFGRFALKYIYF